MKYGILGPVAAWDEGREMTLGGTRQRQLLAVLLIRANELVPTGRLVDELWGERPPATAVKTVQVYVSQLRKLLGEEAIETRPPGYLLRVGPDLLDAHRFEELLGRGRALLAAGSAEEAGRLLREALSLWRGPALADFQYETFARDSIARLEELRLVALEQRLQADLALGRNTEAAPELERLVREHPHRESLRTLFMLALYRAGRQADALAVYQEGRRALVDELGLEPSQALQRLERAILVQDPSLDLPAADPAFAAPAAPADAPAPAPAATPAALTCAHCGRPNPADASFCRFCGASLAPEAPAEARKTVTVLFCDVAAGKDPVERVDPESLRALQSRYFEQAAAVLERHGGTVEKLIGDELMAVFGFPSVHEDDALRAVRAAAELAEADLGAGLMLRIGVATGEVVAGGVQSGRDLVTGEPVLVGRRLEQTAAAGEILLGEQTHALVAHAVEAEPVVPVEVEAIRQPATAFVLRGLNPGAPALPRRDDSPLVGRESELGRLLELYREVAAGRGARHVTLVGDAGMGKSRLARELLREVGTGASVHVGRCPPYGEGITFWPLRGLLPPERLEAPSHEIFAATRQVLVELAERRPVIAAFEDIHWAEPTFLDLVEYLAGRLGDTRVLVLCLSRPDRSEARSAWLRDAIVLEPLSEEQSERLLDGLDVEPELRARIAAAAEGNPLYVEQFAAIADPSLPLPASIRGVLAERLDRLERDELAILQAAAVVGRDFTVSAVADLSTPEPPGRVATVLFELARNGLVRPDPGSPDEGYRFQHALIRDAAYETTPKTARGALHERAGDRLEEAGADPALVGHHYERAYLALADLGPPDAAAATLGVRAAERLAVAGRGSRARSDLPAGIGLLERAAALLPAQAAPRLALLPELAGALIEAGRLAEAEAVLDEAAALARGTGDERAEAHVLVQRQVLQLQRVEPEQKLDVAGVLRRVVPVFERHRDDRGLCSAHKLEASTRWNDAQAGAATAAWERAAACARRAGEAYEVNEILSWIASSLFFGPTPVGSGIARCEEIRTQVRGALAPEAATLRPLAGLYAMEGRFELARELLAESAATFENLGLSLISAVSHHEAVVEILAGDYAAAERGLLTGYRTLEEMGETALLSTTAAFLAEVVLAQGRAAEAERYCSAGEELAASDDVLTQVMCGSVRARLLAAEGQVGKGEELIRAAIARAERTDFLNQRADAHAGLAAMLLDAGRLDPGREAAEQALELYRAKGNAVAAARLESRLGVAGPA